MILLLWLHMFKTALSLFLFQEHCESLYDAYLVAIDTAAENDWLVKTFVERDIGSKGEKNLSFFFNISKKNSNCIIC